jgi:hypothetical protein
MNQAYRTAADIRDLLAKKRSDPAEPIAEDRKRLYRQAAAVLVSLKAPESLQPVGGEGRHGEAEQTLTQDLIPATGRNFDGKVMLHPDARRAAIMELPTIKSRQRALDANPAERTGSLQLQLERYLLNVEIPLDEQPPEQLDETLQIVTWLEGALPNLPPIEQVQGRLARRSFVAPFESLAGDAVFRGRRKELDQLRSFIGVLAPDALLTRVKSWASDWVRPNAMPALSISGPGGVGKSALVARFMLEHSRLVSDARLVFAYLDFDRSVLSVTEPETLLAEILNQLDLQFQSEGYFREFRDSIAQRMTTAQQGKSADPTDNYSRVTAVISQLMKLIEDSLGPRLFVIVLDTFEEVQYRGESLAFPLWEMLDRMQQSFPFLRVVISGRAPVTSLILAGKEPEQLVLGDLDNEAAVAYLNGLGIQDTELAQVLVKQLGGVPLSLKQAAGVIKRDGVERVSDISRKPSFFSSISDSAIQGLLFTRILGHLHDPVLEKVAHPGLVLRRLSPIVILNVLNEPCELGLSSLEEAQVLFDKLRLETSLVASDTLDGTLVHRPELRRTMLKLLVEKEPDRAAQINRKAADWYASQSGWRAKVEELYHRLQLRQTPVDRGFENPDIRSSLQSSISELPAASQRYLATLGYQIDPKVLSEASREDQESALAAEVESLLPYGTRSVARAEHLLTTFKADHASPLFAAAARVAAQQGRFTDATALLKTGLEKAFLDFNSSQALTLLAEQAWLLRVEILAGASKETITMLGDYARQYNWLLLILQHRVQTFGFPEKQKADAKTKAQALREISALLNQLTSDDLWFVFPLLRNIVGLLDEDARRNLIKLICNEAGPFLRVRFATRPPQDALTKLLKVAGSPDLTALPGAIQNLCDLWPFQILRVKPPYSSSTFGHDR